MTRFPLRSHRARQLSVFAPVLARYADVDPLWHINNVAVAQYFERPGLRCFGKSWVRARRHPTGRLILARQTIDYLREGSYPGMFEQARPSAVSAGRR